MVAAEIRGPGIHDQLIGELQRVLDEIGDDSNHPQGPSSMPGSPRSGAAMSDDPEVKRRGRALKDEFLDHPAVRDYFHEVWEKVREFLVASLSDSQSLGRLAIDGELRGIGHGLREDGDVNRQVNRWLRDLILYLVDNYRQPLSAFISRNHRAVGPRRHIGPNRAVYRP